MADAIATAVPTPVPAATVEASVQEFLAKAQEQVATVEALTIETDEQAAAAAVLKKRLDQLGKDCESQRKGWTAPLNSYVKKLNAMFKPAIVQIDDLKSRLRKQLVAFQEKREAEARAAEEKRRRHEAEALRLQQEAEQKAEEARQAAEALRVYNERIQNDLIASHGHDCSLATDEATGRLSVVCNCPDDADALPDSEPAPEPYYDMPTTTPLQARLDAQRAKEAARKADEQATAQPPVPATNAKTWSGGQVASRKVWTHEVQNDADVPIEYRPVDEKLIRAAVRAGVRDIPGVRIYQKREVY